MDAPSVLSAFFSEILDLDGGGYQYTKNDSAELNNLDIHS